MDRTAALSKPRAVFAGAVVLALATSGSAAQEEERPLSPAQIALFETDHLVRIAKAERLEYSFRRDAADSYRDQVAIDVHPRADGGKDVWTEFLSGERRMPFPPVMDFHGNPVIMYFLEHDVIEMNRETGGAATYFRNRIRRAFVDGAQVRPIAIERGGTSVPATEITLRPFIGDNRLAAVPGLADKQYRFVLSDEIPGAVLEIQTVGPARDGQAAAKETMTFEGERPCTGEVGPCAPVAEP